MKEIRTNNAVVRIHGSAEREKTEAATIRFLKEVEKQRREKK